MNDCSTSTHGKAKTGRSSGRIALALVVSTVLLGAGLACSSGRERSQERYVSGQTPVRAVGGQINLDEVQKAFWDTRGASFQEWMGNFEHRVNQIYDGNEVVSIDANRDGRYFMVTGYVNRDADPAFNPSSDELLFRIEQTADAANNQIPYRISGWDNRPYYTGYHGITHSPFLDALIVGATFHALTRPPHYYTPSTRTVIIRQETATYRRSSDYSRQRQANTDFYRRTGSGERTTSSRSFGSSTSSSGERKRSWFGGGGTPSTTSSSGWSGRRGGSMGTDTSSSSTSSWSGRRGGSYSSSSSTSSSSRRRRR